MFNPILQSLQTALSMGLITKTGYTLESVRLLEIENPMECDRQWLADQLGMTYSALTQNLHRLKALGFFDKV
jgi:DNA-binding MarR family transcriptional regulator